MENIEQKIFLKKQIFKPTLNYCKYYNTKTKENGEYKDALHYFIFIKTDGLKKDKESCDFRLVRGLIDLHRKWAMGGLVAPKGGHIFLILINTITY